jgi:hypothetical protein
MRYEARNAFDAVLKDLGFRLIGNKWSSLEDDFRTVVFGGQSFKLAFQEVRLLFERNGGTGGLQRHGWIFIGSLVQRNKSGSR